MLKIFERQSFGGPGGVGLVKQYPGGYSISLSYFFNRAETPPFEQPQSFEVTPMFGDNGDQPGESYIYNDGPQTLRFAKAPTKFVITRLGISFVPGAPAVGQLTGTGIPVYMTVVIGTEQEDIPPKHYLNGTRGGTLPVMANGRSALGEIRPIRIDEVGNLLVSSITPAGNGTTNSVASSIVQVTLQAANSNRQGVTIMNDSTATLFVSLSALASSTNYTCKVPPGGYYETPYRYGGIVTGIWSAVNGAARVTEVN